MRQRVVRLELAWFGSAKVVPGKFHNIRFLRNFRVEVGRYGNAKFFSPALELRACHCQLHQPTTNQPHDNGSFSRRRSISIPEPFKDTTRHPFLISIEKHQDRQALVCSRGSLTELGNPTGGKHGEESV